MSSPSAPPSSDITRQHTPAEAEGEDELPEEQLPEKVRNTYIARWRVYYV
jgi:hypothetical protein